MCLMIPNYVTDNPFRVHTKNNMYYINALCHLYIQDSGGEPRGTLEKLAKVKYRSSQEAL